MANNQISKAFQFEGQPEEQFRITLRLQNDEEVYSHPKSSEPRQGQCSRCHRTQCWHSKTGALLEPLMKKLRHDETECAICKDAINARQWLFHNPYCNHVLHFECYHMHCQNDRRAAHLCPTCRQPIRPWLITDYFDASLPEIVPSKALCQAAKASHAAVIKGDLFVSADAKLPFNVGQLSFTEDQVIQVKSTRRANILDPPTQPRWMFAGEDHFGEAGDLGSLVWRCNPDSTHTAIGILVQEIGNAGDRRGGLVVPWEQVLQALPDDIVL
eukprot:m.43871 g.43871  ORF g.43871 m.43871 type:complete len:271 (-) comp12968_c0_seq2:65-877(-)